MRSTAENLDSLDFQIEKDKERLADIQRRIEAEQTKYEPAHEVFKTVNEIEEMGQKTITGKVAVTKEDYQKLTALAKEGITSRGEIRQLNDSVSYYRQRYFNASSSLERMQARYEELKEKCRPFLEAMEHFPQLVKAFVDKVKETVRRKGSTGAKGTGGQKRRPIRTPQKRQRRFGKITPSTVLPTL